MKLLLKLLLACLAGLVLVSNLHAQGYIVPNGVFYVGPTGVGFEFDVVYDPYNGYTTGFSFIPSGKTPPTAPYVNTFLFQTILNTGVDVYDVSPGTTLDSQTVLSGQLTQMNPVNYVYNSTVPFYVGLYTGNDQFYPQNGIYTDPLFGWAELQYSQGNITLLNSALEYQGGGIIVGTDTIIPVPEPSTWAVIAGGAGLLGVLRRRCKG